MESELFLYNTLGHKKEKFIPLEPPYVGMYVCGPTVYSNAHIGNARTYLTFDLLYRYLLVKGYKVRYVRNVTDAGHLEGDSDEGEDKISKKARLASLEPMEIVLTYTEDFHAMLRELNLLMPNIEPTVTGHIIEQIRLVQKIIDSGYAYLVNGTVYFDVEKFGRKYNYGLLSGRKPEEQLNNTRNLKGQQEKKGRFDFALWINAKPQHLMKWDSPWGLGFPGWHLECSAISVKYLGKNFDIHGGGMDLIPTHHTNEIAQHTACWGANPARFWVHSNLLTVNGQKMSKSFGNSLLPSQMFSGRNTILKKAYSPMVVRFFLLQAHYRSIIDISDHALQAAQKGFGRLMSSYKLLLQINPSPESTFDTEQYKNRCYAAMDDDLNTPVLLSVLFEISHQIRSIYSGEIKIDSKNLDSLKTLMHTFLNDILGLKKQDIKPSQAEEMIKMIIDIRSTAKENRDYATGDFIRLKMEALGIKFMDTEQGTTWEFE